MMDRLLTAGLCGNRIEKKIEDVCVSMDDLHEI